MEATQMENVDKQLDIAFALTSALHVKGVIKAFQNFESFFNISAFTIQIFKYQWTWKSYDLYISLVTILPLLKNISTRDTVRDLRLAKGF